MPDQLRDDLQRALGASYTIERELGGGGMSRVFVATETSFGLAMTYAAMGKRAEALKIAHELEALRQKQWVGPFTIAAVYASVGDRDHAMQWLEQAYREKDWQLRTMLNFDSPYLRSLAGDPRYVALRTKVLAARFED